MSPEALPAPAAIPAADQEADQCPDLGPGRPAAITRRRYWHLATNQLNLMYLLAAGLITGPRGFGRKYYRDALGALPGLIPLFAERIPTAALAEAVAEGPHLRAVIALIDLSGLRGPVLAMTPDGKLHGCIFPDGLAGDESLLLVPAPLPAHWIKTLLFASAEHKAATQAEATAYANVPLAGYKQQVKARLFDGDALLPWPPTPMPPLGPEPDPASGPTVMRGRATPLTMKDFAVTFTPSSASDEEPMAESDFTTWQAPSAWQDASPGHVSAVGAALALLYALGNKGAATAMAARALWSLPLDMPDSLPLEIPHPSADLTGPSAAPLAAPAKGERATAAPTLIQASPASGEGSGKPPPRAAEPPQAPGGADPPGLATHEDPAPNGDPTLRALLRWAMRIPGTRADGVQGQLLQRLFTALVAAADSADPCPPDPRQVVLEVLAEEASRLAEPKWRDALTRLGQDLRGSVTLGDATISELLQRHPRPFSRGLLLFFLRERYEELLTFRHPALTAQDQVVAAALFAARWGWMALPATLRAVPGLAPAVQHRMAALAHHQGGTGIDLGPAPPPVLPLRALLETAPPKAAQIAALRLARGMGWEHQVLTTRISLGKGDYRLTIDGRGAHLLLAGDVKAVSSEVDQAALLARLAGAEIPARMETELRGLLEPGVRQGPDLAGGIP